MTDTQQVRETINNVLNRVLTESGRPAHTFADNEALSKTAGLDSLDLATAVVGLERELGVDPFRDGASPTPTFGDFVQIYVEACEKRT